MNITDLNKENPYVNPFTDFGFKKLFGEEDSKRSLTSFLNDILPIEDKIIEITFGNSEFLGVIKEKRKSVFDIYCVDEKKHHFIVELQNARQEFFKDRTVYYSTFPIQKQAIKGKDWDFKLCPVYCIALLGFEFVDETVTEQEEIIAETEYLHTIALKDQNNKVFYKKLTFVFIEFPKFNKTEDELTTHLDKWLYIFKNLATLTEVPSAFHEPIFEEIFEKATVANFTQAEHDQYLDSFLALSDNMNVIHYARKEGEAKGKVEGLAEGKAEGLAEGEAKGQAEIIRSMQNNGISLDAIANMLKLTVVEIKLILNILY